MADLEEAIGFKRSQTGDDCVLGKVSQVPNRR